MTSFLQKLDFLQKLGFLLKRAKLYKLYVGTSLYIKNVICRYLVLISYIDLSKPDIGLVKVMGPILIDPRQAWDQWSGPTLPLDCP